MAKGAEAGSAFLAGVLAKLPAGDREKGQEALQLLQTLGSGAIVTAIGDGTLAQDELSRKLDELKTAREALDTRVAELDETATAQAQTHEQQTAWWTANRAALTEFERLKKDGKVVADPTKVAPGGITEEQFNERMQTTTSAFLGFSRDQNLITREHFARFGEVPDLTPLLQHPKIAELGLIGVYNEVHKERLATHEAARVAKAEEAIRADERRKVMEANAQMPYPPPTGVGSGSPLDALPGIKDNVADAATQHYNRIQAERAAGGATT